MSRIAIDLGFVQIYWYSICIILGMMVGMYMVLSEARKHGIGDTTMTNLIFNTIITAIIGARLYYVLFNWGYYSRNFIEVFEIWQGGLAIHGGIIAGILFLFIYTRRHRINLFDITDSIAPALALGQAIGRWGNFFNMEAYGPKTTIFELRRLHIPNFVIDGMYINGTYHHPTFFYESIACFIIFIVLIIISRIKNIKLGQTTGIYFILYGIVRFFVESLRQALHKRVDVHRLVDLVNEVDLLKEIMKNGIKII